MKTKFFAVLAYLSVGMIYVNDAKSIDYDEQRRAEHALSYFYEATYDCKFAESIFNTILRATGHLHNCEERLRFFCGIASQFGDYIEARILENGINDALYSEDYAPEMTNIDFMDSILACYERLRQVHYLDTYRISDTLSYTALHRNYNDDIRQRLQDLVQLRESTDDNYAGRYFTLNLEYLKNLHRVEMEEL